MFGYRHAYHAGNFADVFKHALLLELLRALARKDKPYCVLDSHAGIGLYDLDSEAARSTGDFEGGIGRLWAAGEAYPALADYLARVRAVNPDGALRRYPGSPRLVRDLLRPGDRLLACELNPRDHERLKALFAGDPRVAVHRRDGYEALKALLPPPERRGLVFMDPPYEGDGEYPRLTAGLTLLHRRWPQGIAAVWYPILAGGAHRRFFSALRQAGIGAMLYAQLGRYPDDSPQGMNGCGMLVVNPPWRLEEALEPLLRDLGRALAGRVCLERLSD